MTSLKTFDTYSHPQLPNYEDLEDETWYPACPLYHACSVQISSKSVHCLLSYEWARVPSPFLTVTLCRWLCTTNTLFPHVISTHNNSTKVHHISLHQHQSITTNNTSIYNKIPIYSINQYTYYNILYNNPSISYNRWLPYYITTRIHSNECWNVRYGYLHLFHVKGSYKEF